MAKLDAQQVKELFKRIKKSNEGQDFIDYLTTLSYENYEAFKREKGAEFNEVHKGYAVAIDNLINIFAECDKER